MSIDKLAVDGAGDCYEAAVRVMLDADPLGRPEMRLCHGTPLGTGGDALGLRYGHAWVEAAGGVIVIDNSNGHDYTGLRERYYAAGTVDPDEVVRYTYEEMLRKLASTKHYGPWR